MRWISLVLIVFCVWAAPAHTMANGKEGKGRQMMLGSKCTYREIPGNAVITRISKADPNAGNCKNGMEIRFSFTPDDPRAQNSYIFPQHSDEEQRLTVGAGMNPSSQWIEAKGITVGSGYRCIRKEITQGSCTPVLFVFPDIDFSDWDKKCF